MKGCPTKIWIKKAPHDQEYVEKDSADVELLKTLD